ncbi:alpha/beta hydrolase [Aestuariivivens sediminis]|uniref:alpha/beta hydrolase n=1 Tax=Aestuariivivens sediminis TaxID=2913557 RepID=UPI001F596179|nr:alpha/beta hydrolase-fold protein [Aestuariivivens sediminis]
MMKRYLLVLFAILITLLAHGQSREGKFIQDQLYSTALENKGGENPTRRVSVYLPPGYDMSTDKYPVIYYLHGITQSDSSLIAKNNIDKMLNKAIAAGKIRPLIFVMCDQFTLYRGSFYTNSSLTGNWSDFTAKDLVSYVDQKYRTIPERESRGIAGHSMGGHGAIKLGMLFPDVFSSVYALSPYVLGLEKDYGVEGEAYKQAQMIQSRDTLITGYKYLNANAVVAVGRAFSPNANKPPFYADLPYSYSGDSLIVNYKVLDLWNKNLPNEMIKAYVSNLKSLKAIKLDWGRDDFFTHIPPTSKTFSEKLAEFGINHFAEEYNGSHLDKIYTDDGRFMNDMLPFFNTYLKF